MDKEVIKNEILDTLHRMGFAGDVETIDAVEGVTNRFCVRMKNPPQRDLEEEKDFADTVQEGIARPSPSHMLIGERGNTLSAIEHIVKKLLKKKYNVEEKFTLDINDYRIKRLDDLKHDIKAAAKEVRLHKKEVPLRAMSSFERRIVHLLLAEYPDITTESTGSEPNRRVIIKPYL